MADHDGYPMKALTADSSRAPKKRRVEEGTTHPALVFDGDRAVAWCEYGTPTRATAARASPSHSAALSTSWPG
jgi:hypothetical protein